MSDLGQIYRNLTPSEKASHLIGQIFWIPAYCQMQDYYVVRIDHWDRSSHISTAQFRIERKTLGQLGRAGSLFRHMPVPELKLKMDEELVVKKVKRRPAVLVVREGVNPRRLATYFSGSGAKPNPNSHVFAPIVSLRKEDNVSADYPQPFIEKVSTGELPEFIHLPARGSVLRNESMAILTQLQLHGEKVVEETDLALDTIYFGAALESFWQDLEGQVLNA